MRACRLALLGLGLVLLARPARAQAPLPPLPPDTTAARYGTSTAVAFLLTEYGLGVGLAGRTRLTDDLSVAVELAVGAGRDEREQEFFFDPFESEIPLKRHYVLLAPLHIGVEQRLFRRTVEDNFRPFLHASLGPTLGLQWPYFDDFDGDGRRDLETEETLGVFERLGDAEPRLGVGGTMAMGAAVGRGRTMLSFRFGVSANVFPVPIELLEVSPEVESPSRRAFWTPVVTFHVGRLAP